MKLGDTNIAFNDSKSEASLACCPEVISVGLSTGALSSLGVMSLFFPSVLLLSCLLAYSVFNQFSYFLTLEILNL